MKIGFIGAGNMASAIVEGMVQKGFSKPENIYLYDIATEKVQAFAEKIGAHALSDPQEVIKTVDTLILAVKPNVFETDQPIRIVRVMPNMNAMVGEGAAAVCGNPSATKEDVATIIDLFNAVGKAWPLEEKYFSIFTAIAGSSPAYTFLFIDSIARAAVKNGLPKNIALEMATQAILGSAETLAYSKENPWELIDRVSSPGGTTVAGIVELEDNAFISTVIKGIDATIRKDEELGKK